MLQFKQRIVKLLVIFLIALVSVQVSANGLQCAQFFSPTPYTQKIKNSVINYAKEVKDSKGLSLLAQKTDGEVRFGGFFTPMPLEQSPHRFARVWHVFFDFFHKNISQIILGDPSYRFSPMNGFNQTFMVKPFQWIFRTQKVPAFLTSVLMFSAYSYGLDQSFMDYYNYRIEAKQTAYIKMIEGDYRFHFIKEDVDSHVYTMNTAIQNANIQTLALEKMVDIHPLDAKSIDLEKEIPRIENSNLFSNMRDYFIEGVVPKEGYRLLRPSGALTDKEKKSLVSIAYTLYAQYALVSDFIFKPESIEEKRNVPDLLPLIQDIENNGYRKQLETLYKDHRISAETYNYRTQEDYFNQSSFAAYSVLGIEPLDDNGKPFTLKDVRNENMREILSTGH